MCHPNARSLVSDVDRLEGEVSGTEDHLSDVVQTVLEVGDRRYWVVRVVKCTTELVDTVQLVKHGYAEDASLWSKADESIPVWVDTIPCALCIWAMYGIICGVVCENIVDELQRTVEREEVGEIIADVACVW